MTGQDGGAGQDEQVDTCPGCGRERRRCRCGEGPCHRYPDRICEPINDECEIHFWTGPNPGDPCKCGEKVRDAV